MEKLRIRKNLIGAKVYHPTLNVNITIEVGKEDYYEKLGMDVFTKRRKPKLQKNDSVKKKSSNSVSRNSNRKRNDKQS